MKTNNKKYDDHEFEDDSVWDLVDQAPHTAPSSTFLQDTLRRARLEGQATSPWWQKILSPKPLIGFATAACAAVAIMISLKSDPSPTPAPVAKDTQPAVEEFVALEDALANELLVIASEDPSLFSDTEIMMLLF